ncbi:MAG: hypothetical protein FWB86_13880 [Treponema sp.]|nr:hypothetical protein [Treponema sp.]
MKLVLNKNAVLARTIPSLIIFIGVTLLCHFVLFKDSANLYTSILGGWMFGGLIWGWSITKSWFPRFSFFDNSPGLSAESFAHSVKVLLRFGSALIVGAIALPIGIVITIITFISSANDIKKAAMAEAATSDAVEALAKAEAEEKNEEITADQ